MAPEEGDGRLASVVLGGRAVGVACFFAPFPCGVMAAAVVLGSTLPLVERPSPRG